MHRNFLPDRIFLLNYYEERSMIMMSPLLSIKIYNKSLKINNYKLFQMVFNCLISEILFSKSVFHKKIIYGYPIT